ncbi:MAG: amidohydrolase family protein [Oscillospiraceae bacterium]|nr:amidohydrolase family protein [Oscillospiraceae bacterium]
MISEYTLTEHDRSFFAEQIDSRLPQKIWDIHQHISLEKNIGDIPPEMYAADWAIQCGAAMTAEEYRRFSADIYPGREVHSTAFGAVIKGGNHAGHNQYIASLVRDKKLDAGFMILDPSVSAEETARIYDEGGFSGYKPYADMVACAKAADITFPEFMPDAHMKVLNDRKGILMLHVPRAGRLPDDRNIRELKELRQKFPDITIIIAHMGRSYCPAHFLEAMEKLGSDVNAFHYDFAAVLNPAVIEAALEHLNHDQIHYGTDLPVFWWHGRRQWTETSYRNLARENFPWNQHVEGKEVEEGYTLFLYEQLKNLLDVTGQAPNATELREKIFYRNSAALF